jgi:pyruvate,water dikinase
MFILADPEKAYDLSFYPNQGVGLMRMEFVINNTIRIHPMALVHFDSLSDLAVKKQIEELCFGYADKKEYFIDKLSQAIGTIAASFSPKDVILRMSDFKTNEYANLIGGTQFEEEEANPMIGFRGASRYYNDRYRDGFHLECEAIKRVRNEMSFNNLKLMIPFCRTVEEGKKVIELLESYGLKQGENGLEVYVMAEVPSNVILAEDFAEIFDGFSIGSNDLTQLTLGVDRDSENLAELFDENNPAVKWMISRVIEVAKKNGKKIGLCGQAPSDNPEYAKFLINQGIDSISFNSDAMIKGIENMILAEADL